MSLVMLPNIKQLAHVLWFTFNQNTLPVQQIGIVVSFTFFINSLSGETSHPR